MEGPPGVSRQYFYFLTTNFPSPGALLTELCTLADRFQDCHSVEDVTAVLREQAQDFKKFQEKDKVLKPLKNVLTILQLLSSVPPSSVPRIGQHLHPVRPKVLNDVQCL